MDHSVGQLSLLRAALEFFIGCLLRQYSSLASHRYWTPVALATAALWGSSFWTSLPLGLLAIPLFAALILAAGTPTIIARLLTWLPMLAIGEASYTLYMMQAPIQKGARVLEHYFRPDQSVQNAAVAVAYLGTLALGTFLVHRFVENPSRRRLRYLIEAYLPRPRVRTRATRRPLRPQLGAVFSR
jgi:peptidoglycan/LPS O-acetylase OafA/YrhL